MKIFLNEFFTSVNLCLSGSEVGALRQDALSILMTSELVKSNKSPSIFLGPGSTQYLLSLARVALNAIVEIPELWGSPEFVSQLLQHLLECPDYEVRELTLEQVLKRLQEEDLRRPEWLDKTTQCNLTSMAFHETHPRCLAKVRTHTHPFTGMHSLIGCAFVYFEVFDSLCLFVL